MKIDYVGSAGHTGKMCLVVLGKANKCIKAKYSEGHLMEYSVYIYIGHVIVLLIPDVI